MRSLRQTPLKFVVLSGACAGLILIWPLASPGQSADESPLPGCQATTSLMDLQARNPGVDFLSSELVTRAKLARTVVQSYPWLKPFSGTPIALEDVPETHPAYSFIQVATREGLMGPYRDKMFFPDAPVNRDEAISVLTQALGIPPLDEGRAQQVLANFPDGLQTRSWAHSHVAIAVERGFIILPDGRLRPNQPATAGEVNQILGCQREALKAQGSDKLPQLPGQSTRQLVELRQGRNPWLLPLLGGGILIFGGVGMVMLAKAGRSRQQDASQNLPNLLTYEVTETWEGSQKPLKRQLINLYRGSDHWFGRGDQAVYQPADTQGGEPVGKQLLNLHFSTKGDLLVIPGQRQEVYLNDSDRPLPAKGRALLMEDEFHITAAGRLFRLKPTANPDEQKAKRDLLLNQLSQPNRHRR